MIDEVHRNIYDEERNYLILVTGKTGKGKSLSAGINYALAINPEFTINNVVWDEKGFMNLVKTCKPGDVILADEIGAWMGNRDYNTLVNKMLSMVIQTFRYKRLVVIWTAPLKRQVDVHLRIMCDENIEVLSINRARQQVNARCFEPFEMNDGRLGRKLKVIQNERGENIYITRVHFDRPPKGIEDEYKRMKPSKVESKYDKALGHIDGINNPVVKDTITCDKCDRTWTPKHDTLIGNRIRCPSCSHSQKV